MRAPTRRDITEKQKDRKESSDTEGQKANTQYHPQQNQTTPHVVKAPITLTIYQNQKKNQKIKKKKLQKKSKNKKKSTKLQKHSPRSSTATTKPA